MAFDDFLEAARVALFFVIFDSVWQFPSLILDIRFIAAALLFASSYICENISDNIRNGWEGLSNKLVSQSERKKNDDENGVKWMNGNGREIPSCYLLCKLFHLFLLIVHLSCWRKRQRKTNDVDLSSGVFSCSTKVFIYLIRLSGGGPG